MRCCWTPEKFFLWKHSTAPAGKVTEVSREPLSIPGRMEGCFNSALGAERRTTFAEAPEDHGSGWAWLHCFSRGAGAPSHPIQLKEEKISTKGIVGVQFKILVS
uniref:Uncharacterized protein n=1 Tax=Micrurus corallinus TaxID=54390 RepID=A0A2D4GI68_MICCO